MSVTVKLLGSSLLVSALTVEIGSARKVWKGREGGSVYKAIDCLVLPFLAASGTSFPPRFPVLCSLLPASDDRGPSNSGKCWRAARITWSGCGSHGSRPIFAVMHDPSL
jgi:hypothetical protein